jgi:hypothetical protein
MLEVEVSALDPRGWRVNLDRRHAGIYAIGGAFEIDMIGEVWPRTATRARRQRVPA